MSEQREDVGESTQPFQVPEEGLDDVGRETPETEEGEPQSEPAEK